MSEDRDPRLDMTYEELGKIYGLNAKFSRKGNFLLVHLDDPDEETIRKRTEEFDPDAYFDDNCPLCQIAKSMGGCFTFDAYDENLSDEEL